MLKEYTLIYYAAELLYQQESYLARAANKYLSWQDKCLITFIFGRTSLEFSRSEIQYH